MFQDCIKNALIVLVLSLFCSSAFSKDYQEGRHYELIEPLPTRNPEKIEVIEFFWFGCGHCFSLEQLIKDWKSEVSSEVDFSGYLLFGMHRRRLTLNFFLRPKLCRYQKLFKGFLAPFITIEK